MNPPSGDFIEIALPALKDVVATSFWYKVSAANYNDIIHPCKVIITNRPVTVKSGTKLDFVYDGQPHAYTNLMVKSGSFVTGEGIATSNWATVTTVAEGQVDNAFDYAPIGGTKLSNYDFSIVTGKIAVVSPGTVVVTITGHVNQVAYDGIVKSVSGYDVVSISDPLYTATDFKFTGIASTNGADAGTYPMGLTSSQFANTNENFAAVTFNVTDGGLTIAQATNIWTTVPAIEGWTFGESAKTPVGAAKFGAVSFDYSPKPVGAAGDYTMTASVAATGNYTGLSTNVNFTIAKAVVPPGSDPGKPDPSVDPSDPGQVKDPAVRFSPWDYVGIYDGEWNTVDTIAMLAAYAAVVGADCTVQFAAGSGVPALPWSDAAPMFKDVVATSFWYKVSAANYNDIIHPCKVIITNRPVTVESGTKTDFVYDGQPHAYTNLMVKSGSFVTGEGIVTSNWATVTTVADGQVDNAFDYTPLADTKLSNYDFSVITGKIAVVEGTAITGRFFRAPLEGIVSGLDIPEGGTITAVKLDGASKGLAVVQDKAEGTWYVEGVPMEDQDYLRQPMFVRVTVTVGSTKLALLCPLELEIRAPESLLIVNGRSGVPYSGVFVTNLWPGVARDTSNWTITGWPTGIKCNLSSKPVTGKDAKTKAVITNAQPFEVYGNPTKAGCFTVTATHKVMSASKKSYVETFAATFLVETAKGGIRYRDTAFVELTRALDEDVVSVSGLPSGLKADVKTHSVSGSPKKAAVSVVTYKRLDPSDSKGKKTIDDIFLWEITPGKNNGILDGIDWRGAKMDNRCIWLEQGVSCEFPVDVPNGAVVTVSALPRGLSMKSVVTNTATRAKATTIVGIPSDVADYVATFKTVMNGVTVVERVSMRVVNSSRIPVPAEYGPFTPGVFASVDLMPFADCKVTGLPTGLKLVSETEKTTKKVVKYAVEGIPTVCGRFVVTFTKMVNKVGYVARSTFVVSDYPEIPIALKLASKSTEGGWVRPGETLEFYCGVCQDFALDCAGLDGVETTISQDGLPTGLKLVKVTKGKTKGVSYLISGVPTVASKFKDGAFVPSEVVLSASNKYKWHGKFEFTVIVRPLPEWAYGTYNGGSEAGQVTLTIADKTGKLSGKFVEGGQSYALAASSYASVEGGGTNFTTEVTASWSCVVDKKTVKTNELWKIIVSEGEVGGIVRSSFFEAWQNPWPLRTWKELGVELFGKNGTEIDLRGEDYGLGDEESVRVLIKSTGAAAVTGLFDLGTIDKKGKRQFYTASGSATVCVLSENPFKGLVFVYFPPVEAKGFGGYAQTVPVCGQ